jgi:hypothetical protein
VKKLAEEPARAGIDSRLTFLDSAYAVSNFKIL